MIVTISAMWHIPCQCLTHWGRVTHICVSRQTIIGSDNGLSPGRRQAIIWTNAGILLIGPLGTNLSEILIKIHAFSFKKMHFKMLSGKWWPFCFSLNVLTLLSYWTFHDVMWHHPRVGAAWALQKIGCHLELVIFKLILSIGTLGTSCAVALKWMPKDLTDD